MSLLDNDAIIHLNKDGKPRSVEINGFKIPMLTAFKFEAGVNEIDRLTVTFLVRKTETRMDWDDSAGGVKKP